MKGIYIYILVLSVLFLTGCQDDFPSGRYEIEEGVTQVKLDVGFEPFAPTLTDSRATAGDAIKDIEKLSIVAYVPEGEHETFYKMWHFTKDQLTFAQNTTVPDDYYNDPYVDRDSLHQAEKITVKASVVIPQLKSGKYYMYAVANVDSTVIKDAVKEGSRPDDLKNISFTWQGNDIPANNQMFGYFTADVDGERNSRPSASDPEYVAPPVIIDRNKNSIHCWIKRLASKVTIVYDPSGLHEGIYIRIHKATIKHLPTTCKLGVINTPGENDPLLNDGENIIYGRDNSVITGTDPFPNIDQHENWLELSKKSGKKGAVHADKDGKIVEHGYTEPALYFFENMQGNYSDRTDKEYYNKQPNPNNANHNVDTLDIADDWKDRIAYGTYIEVEGYYLSENPVNMSKGKIKYRFMLGKDTKYDYNAERNMHYKLTLKFRGYANQPDWHIEYDEPKPDAFLPELFYVPYLYNKRVELPIRVTGNLKKVKVQIIENNWAPFDSLSSTLVPPKEVGFDNAIDKTFAFRWNKEVYDNTGGTYTYGLHSPQYYADNYGIFKDEYRKIYPKPDEVKITPIWAGFLSLTVPGAYENYDDMRYLPQGIFNNGSNWWYSSHNGAAGNGSAAINGLREYFLGNYATDGKDKNMTDNKIPQHERELTITSGQTQYGSKLNGYRVERNGDDMTIYMPLFTRPKAMIYISGFSGNNSNEYYMRRAVLRFVFTFDEGNGKTTERVKYLPVYQTRRITNPKAVWRSSGESGKGSFHVILQKLTQPGNPNFEAIESRGAWTAKVTAGKGITLSPTSESEQGNDNKEVKGSTGSNIDFKINFTEQGDNNYCALVSINYHGGSAIHTIFVRRGYDKPIQVHPTGAYWSSYSVYKFNSGNYGDEGKNLTAELTVNPLQLGTMFKRGNYQQGIRVINNANYGPLVSVKDKDLELSNGTQAKWTNIKGKTAADRGEEPVTNYTWCDFTATVHGKKKQYRVPTMEEYQELLNHDVAFGVCYADGATEVATNTVDAFSYYNHGNLAENIQSEQGIRGVISYNPTNGNNIFFPVGSFGVGRRTNYSMGLNADNAGYLRYGASGDVLSVEKGPWNEHRPVCYDIVHAPGAIYWAKKALDNGNLAWDMNYNDLTFGPYDVAVSYNGYGDAIPIKPVWERDLE